MADKIKKKFKHIAVDEETFNRFRKINEKTTDSEVLKNLIDIKERQ